MRKKLMVITLLAVSICFLASSVHADGYGCKRKGKGMEQKLFKKAGFLWMNQDEIGLSEEQVGQIKEIKIESKKELVKRNAEIDTVKIEIKSKLYDDDIDVVEVDKLIGQKYDMKKGKAKYLVKQYVKLKGVLTADQMDEAKKIWRKNSK